MTATRTTAPPAALRALAAVFWLGLLTPEAAYAAGPLAVNGAGTPLVWDTAVPVPFNPDRGKLGALDNATAVAEVVARFGTWAAVPTAAITFVNAGALPVDVTAQNVLDYYAQCDGLSPVIFDVDGSLIDALLGGGSTYILGFATPECGEYDPPRITESFTVLNGRFLDGTDGAGNPEMSLAEFAAVLVHEFGHFLNLDHSQINLIEAFDGDPGNDAAVATMFPLHAGPEQMSLHLDDMVSLSRLYPGPVFTSGRGRIAGTISQFDPETPFQGAYVIARRLDDPRVTAVGGASGDRWFPGQPGGTPPAGLEGAYELPGLPPGDYTVEVEQIDARFEAGSSVGPLEIPADIGGPPEFWNGADEAGTDPPDDPTEAVPLVVAAGADVDGIDVVINEPPPPPNDACSSATELTGLQLDDFQFTNAATTDPDDPVQSCTEGGPSQNLASVWYRFTPPTDGRLVLSTWYHGLPLLPGVPYDTVATIHSGTCGGLIEVACNDTSAPSESVGRQASVGADVTAGETYFGEVTAHHADMPGRLRVHFDFRPDSPICPDGRFVTRLRMKASKLAPPLGDERLRLTLNVRSQPFDTAVIDPLTNGLQLFIEDEDAGWTPYFGLASVTSPPSAVPAGAPGSGCGPKDGWRANPARTNFTYVNESGALPSAGCAPGSARGLERVTVKDRREPDDLGWIAVALRARNAGLTVPFQDGPADTALYMRIAVSFTAFDGTACGEISVPCSLGRRGDSLDCRHP